jgi:hypothetical protein
VNGGKETNALDDSFVSRLGEVSELGEASGSKGTKHAHNLFSRILSGSGSSTTYILFMLMFIETPFLSGPE